MDIGAALCHRQPAVAELRRGGIERGGVAQFEADRVVVRIAFEVHQRVVAVVTAVVVRTALHARQFQADDLACEAVCRAQVTRAEPDVADVEQVDHAIGGP